ncbi:hypothetical protein MAR_037412, partial [Mya arenaria]
GDHAAECLDHLQTLLWESGDHSQDDNVSSLICMLQSPLFRQLLVLQDSIEELKQVGMAGLFMSWVGDSLCHKWGTVVHNHYDNVSSLKCMLQSPLFKQLLVLQDSIEELKPLDVVGLGDSLCHRWGTGGHNHYDNVSSLKCMLRSPLRQLLVLQDSIEELKQVGVVWLFMSQLGDSLCHRWGTGGHNHYDNVSSLKCMLQSPLRQLLVLQDSIEELKQVGVVWLFMSQLGDSLCHWWGTGGHNHYDNVSSLKCMLRSPLFKQLRELQNCIEELQQVHESGGLEGHDVDFLPELQLTPVGHTNPVFEAEIPHTSMLPYQSTPAYNDEFQRVIEAAGAGREIETMKLFKPEKQSLGF